MFDSADFLKISIREWIYQFNEKVRHISLWYWISTWTEVPNYTTRKDLGSYATIAKQELI